ncbi:MAG: hypothetical protein ACE5FZ_08530, partial [Nitrospiria bacterium]
HARCLGIRLAGDAIEELDKNGNRITGETLLILMNAHHEDVPFALPARNGGTRWVKILDTSSEASLGIQDMFKGGKIFILKERSMAVFAKRRRAVRKRSS